MCGSVLACTREQVCLSTFASKESHRLEPPLAFVGQSLNASELPFLRLRVRKINLGGCKWRPTGQVEVENMFYLVLPASGALFLTELVVRL